MKILITGSKGQLGKTLDLQLQNKQDVYALSSNELNITNKKQCMEIIKQIQPQIVINCAAYNQVDLAETEKDKANQVNQVGIANLAESCSDMQAKLIHISTDYVFDGESIKPYTEKSKANPINYYGYTKYRGEEIVKQTLNKYIIVRTSWLYSQSENNFVATINKLTNKRDHINVISDQIGTPTNTFALGQVIQKLILEDAQGLYHCTGNGQCSWYEFAKKIVKLNGSGCVVNPISTKEYMQAALRPKYSVLDNKKLRDSIGNSMNNWEEELERFFKNN